MKKTHYMRYKLLSGIKNNFILKFSLSTSSNMKDSGEIIKAFRPNESINPTVNLLPSLNGPTLGSRTA